MRTLLVDNYDSYTYNLFQLIAQVQGDEPVVVRNDQAAADIDLAGFDNVVISPGPGDPRNGRDFGILSCNGSADLNIVIRTAVFVGDRMHLGAGGAIVLGSDPAAEYDEMLLKLAAPMRAYEQWTATPAAAGTPASGRRTR